MSYIRIERFWDFQNADAWKKAAQAKRDHARHPNWCKLVVKRDYEMDLLPVPTRLLYLELLRLATQHSNVIPNDCEWIVKQISMEPGDVAQGLHTLLKGRWIKVTQTNRLSREILETFATRTRTRTRTIKPTKPTTSTTDVAAAQHEVRLVENENGLKAFDLENMLKDIP